MSIFGMIKDAIFGAARQPQAAPSPNAGAFAIGDAAASAASAAAAQAAAAPAQPVDVEAVLTGIERSKGGPALNWRSSIVDLMKVLDLDSSLSARKQLAQELKYSGDMNDSAAMNIWLHKQVMTKLAENGGKVPAELKA